MRGLQEIISTIRAAFPDADIRLNEPMREHISFHIGGPAAVMFLPKSEEELLRIRSLLNQMDISPLVIGNGTNLLVSDAPLDMAVIKTYDGLGTLELMKDNVICAGSGVILSKIAVFAMKNGLTGFEFAHGIPGSFGGAVSMNAGAYGGEIKDVVPTVRYLSAAGEIRESIGEENGFSYRHSRFSETDDIVLSGEIVLSPGNKDEIKAKMDDLSARRRASQPLTMPSAGSTFKRPEKGYAAAMIDEAGLRGYTVGGAQVSEKHAGFVVNTGDATFEDVLRLMEYVQETVLRRFGVQLQPEVKIIK